MEVKGLEIAKQLVKRQKVAVKGDRDQYASGYRRALADVTTAINNEIKRLNEDCATEEAGR